MDRQVKPGDDREESCGVGLSDDKDVPRPSFLNECLRLCGGDVARLLDCVRAGSTRRIWNQCTRCDRRTTFRMSHAHGTYVPACMVDAAHSAYVRINNNKKRKRLWSRRTQKGR
jgi:hypothetical protein